MIKNLTDIKKTLFLSYDNMKDGAYAWRLELWLHMLASALCFFVHHIQFNFSIKPRCQNKRLEKS